MLIALDAGHGGSDPGAVYNGRNEKDDNLRLAMAVGEILESNGIDVFYTREEDKVGVLQLLSENDRNGDHHSYRISSLFSWRPFSSSLQELDCGGIGGFIEASGNLDSADLSLG